MIQVRFTTFEQNLKHEKITFYPIRPSDSCFL